MEVFFKVKKDLEKKMVDGDQIDVLLQQLGGADAESGNGNGGAASENRAEAPITLKVRDQSGEEMFFKVKKGTAMKKIMQAFADRKGVSLEVLRFTIDGTRVNAEDTPMMLSRVDGDLIEVMMLPMARMVRFDAFNVNFEGCKRAMVREGFRCGVGVTVHQVTIRNTACVQVTVNTTYHNNRFNTYTVQLKKKLRGIDIRDIRAVDAVARVGCSIIQKGNASVVFNIRIPFLFQ